MTTPLCWPLSVQEPWRLGEIFELGALRLTLVASFLELAFTWVATLWLNALLISVNPDFIWADSIHA
jgi:hypothetical protein